MNKKYTGFAGPFDPTQVDKAEALARAKKLQKHLLYSKIFYPYIIVMALVGVCDTYFHVTVSGVAWAWLSGLFVVLGIYSIFSTLILGICPYCQQFQKPNGQTLGVDAQSISYSKGVSPFIHRCSRCAAPLSVKAVNHDYAD